MNRTPRGNPAPPAAPPDCSKRSEKPLNQLAQEKVNKNPSALGDPVSLKAEASPRGSGPQKDEGKPKRSLKEAAMNNPTALGDPVSLKAETSDTEPTENDRGALRDGKKRDSKL